MAHVHSLLESTNDFDESGPPYSLDAELAELNERLRTNTWTQKETAWLNDNMLLFDTGVYEFKANEWYPLAHALAEQGGTTKLWELCCQDIQFTFPNPFPIPVQCSKPTTLRDLISSWHYNHLVGGELQVKPHWDREKRCLKTTPHRGVFTFDHLLQIVQAFATEEVMANIHRGLGIKMSFGGFQPPQKLDRSLDIFRCTSWLFSPDIMGCNTPINELALPQLDEPSL